MAMATPSDEFLLLNLFENQLRKCKDLVPDFCFRRRRRRNEHQVGAASHQRRGARGALTTEGANLARDVVGARATHQTHGTDAASAGSE